MTTNKYFNHFKNPREQKLHDDLLIESIKINGQDVYYIPRELVKEDKLFGEDTLSRFTHYFTIEMYLESFDGFEGDGDVFSKFGLQVRDSAKLTVSKTRFKTVTERERPLEGDLIYFPLSGGLFEIKFVEHEHEFYQFGKNHTFQLTVELFQYSQETVETDMDEIDAIVDSRIYRKYITFGAGGFGGLFTTDETVYTYTNGSTAAGISSANATGIVKQVIGTDTVQIENVKGQWENSSDSVTRYISNESGTISKPITGISDTIDADSYDSNKIIQTEANSVLDFSESNPFAEDGRV